MIRLQFRHVLFTSLIISCCARERNKKSIFHHIFRYYHKFPDFFLCNLSVSCVPVNKLHKKQDAQKRASCALWLNSDVIAGFYEDIRVHLRTCRLFALDQVLIQQLRRLCSLHTRVRSMTNSILFSVRSMRFWGVRSYATTRTLRPIFSIASHAPC